MLEEELKKGIEDVQLTEEVLWWLFLLLCFMDHRVCKKSTVWLAILCKCGHTIYINCMNPTLWKFPCYSSRGRSYRKRKWIRDIIEKNGKMNKYYYLYSIVYTVIVYMYRKCSGSNNVLYTCIFLDKWCVPCIQYTYHRWQHLRWMSAAVRLYFLFILFILLIT